MNAAPELPACLAEFLRSRAGVVADPQRAWNALAFLESFAREGGFPSVSEVCARAASDPHGPLADALLDGVLNHETLWFRDIAPFRALASPILPAFLARRPTVRIWSAACSSGQEPYSIALLANEAFPSASIEILASDISPKMLARAAEGRYSSLEMNRGLPAPHLARSFRRNGAGWEIADDLKARVRFRRINLAEPWPPLPPQDVILLRNVLVYMDPACRAVVLRRAAETLAPGGLLFLGSAEMMPLQTNGWVEVVYGNAVAWRVK